MAKRKLFELIKAADTIKIDGFDRDSIMWCKPGEHSEIDGDGEEVFNLVPVVVITDAAGADYAFADQNVTLNNGVSKAKTIAEEPVVLEFYRLLPLSDEDLKENP